MEYKEKVFGLSWKVWVFGISFLYTLLFTIVFGFQGKSIEMGLVLTTGIFGMSFPHLDKIVRIKGAGIELETRVNEKIDELKELEEKLKEQEESLNNLSDYITHALITTFGYLGAIVASATPNASYGGEIFMMGIQLYAYNPKEQDKNNIDTLLSKMTDWLSDGTSTKEPLVKLFKEKQKLILSDYAKMKEKNAPAEIIQKYEMVMFKAGIKFGKDLKTKN